MSVNKVRVVIIDSGIDTKKSDLSKYVKFSTGFRVSEQGYIEEDQKIEVRHDHGTAIAMIIRDICENVELTSINILNERLVTDGRILIHALKHALLLKPDIIHLSLGTTKWRYKTAMKKIVKKASESGILIVSAASNEGIKSYPAYIKGVIGVKGFDAASKLEFYYSEGFFYAPCDLKDIRGMFDIEFNNGLVGNSMSAAYITGQIASSYYLIQTIGIEAFIEKIKLLSGRGVVK